MQDIQVNTCVVEDRFKDKWRLEPGKGSRGTQKRGIGECQSCWRNTDGRREGGGQS